MFSFVISVVLTDDEATSDAVTYMSTEMIN